MIGNLRALWFNKQDAGLWHRANEDFRKELNAMRCSELGRLEDLLGSIERLAVKGHDVTRTLMNHRIQMREDDTRNVLCQIRCFVLLGA